MRKIKGTVVLAFSVLALFGLPDAFALVTINEFLADPPDGLLGDVNRDGVRSSSDDEFVELLNGTEGEKDLSAWTLWDALQMRHQFAPGTLLPSNDRIVVFGGGHPAGIPRLAVTASSGSLSLNNSGDQIILRNAAGGIVDQILFGSEGNLNQSLTRFPEGSGPFQLHTLASSQRLLFSPGTDPEGASLRGTVTTPEPATALLLIPGIFLLTQQKRRRR